MRFLYLIFITTLILTACNKNRKEYTNVVKGQITDHLTGAPMANVPQLQLYLFDKNSDKMKGSSETVFGATITTGHFEHEFNSRVNVDGGFQFNTPTDANGVRYIHFVNVSEMYGSLILNRENTVNASIIHVGVNYRYYNNSGGSVDSVRIINTNSKYVFNYGPGNWDIINKYHATNLIPGVTNYVETKIYKQGNLTVFQDTFNVTAGQLIVDAITF